MKRVLFGTLGGALFGGVVAFAIPALLLLFSLFIHEHPRDREDILKDFPAIVGFCTTCGLLVGGLAGFASHVPAKGVSFLRCCLAIAIPTAIIRLLTAPVPKVTEQNQLYFSYFASFATAILATGILIAIGFKSSRNAKMSDHSVAEPI